MLDKPIVTHTSNQLTAAIHLTVPRDEMRRVMGPGLSELMATLAAQDIEPAGPWFNHHLRMRPDCFDFKISIPLAAPVAASGRVVPSVLPAARVVRTVYHGGYEGLPGAWAEFKAWIEEQGLRAAPDLWECYSVGPESSDDPADWRTELNQPLLEG